MKTNDDNVFAALASGFGVAQKFESEYGQAPLVVEAVIPTISLRYHLGHVHVATPPLEVARETWGRIKQQQDGPQGSLWTRERRRQTLQAALWFHRENWLEYCAVMS